MVAWVIGEPAKGVSARELASPLICHVVPWIREGYPSHSPVPCHLWQVGRWHHPSVDKSGLCTLHGQHNRAGLGGVGTGELP